VEVWVFFIKTLVLIRGLRRLQNMNISKSIHRQLHLLVIDRQWVEMKQFGLGISNLKFSVSHSGEMD
jgi:hypothetical protein